MNNRSIRNLGSPVCGRGTLGKILRCHTQPCAGRACTDQREDFHIHCCDDVSVQMQDFSTAVKRAG